MSNVFDGNTPNPEGVVPSTEDNAKTLAEMKAELDALRKAKEHADPMIESLKRQIDEMRQDMSGMVKPDNILEEIKKLQTKNNEGERPATPEAFDPEAVSRLVEETINKRQAAAVAEANVNRVHNEVTKVYGEKAKEFIAGKAEELGLSLAEMAGMASRSPDAFFKLVGLSVEKKTIDPSPSKSSVVPDSFGSSNQTKAGTFRYYQELRRNDPKTYYSPKVQRQMIKDAEKAKAAGIDFYNS